MTISLIIPPPRGDEPVRLVIPDCAPNHLARRPLGFRKWEPDTVGIWNLAEEIAHFITDSAAGGATVLLRRRTARQPRHRDQSGECGVAGILQPTLDGFLRHRDRLIG